MAYGLFGIRGRLDVIETTETGPYPVISILTQGRPIGERSRRNHFPPASVRTRTNITPVNLDRQSFETRRGEYARIGIKIHTGLPRLLRLVLRKTSSRLAEAILSIT